MTGTPPRPHPARLLAAALVTLLLAACGGSPESRYYLMDAGPPPANEPAGDTVVFVDRATVAAYADRSAIVVRRGATEVAFAEQDAWAEPIAGQVTSVVTDALGDRFGRASVLPTPIRRDREPDFRVAVEVLRFETDASGAALLDARWSVLRGPGDAFAAAGRERLTASPTDPASFDARAAALAATLVELASIIADAIETLPPDPKE